MTVYSIKDLEQLSGIKAHTLRIWEQRYNFIKPNRTDTNIRNYNVEDLKLILNIALLKDHGLKISKIAKLSEEQIQKEVVKIADQQLGFPDQVQALTTSMLELDEERFELIINANVDKFGFETTMINIVYPFLIKIGTLWITGSIGPVQEHFMSNLIRQKLIVAIENIDRKHTAINTKSFVLYLPEGEYHEIGLLFAQYIIRSRGHKITYLGQSLPKGDLEYVVNLQKPDYIFVAITSFPNADNIQKYLTWMSSKIQHTEILLTGYQVMNQPLKLAKNMKVIANIEELISMIESHK